MLGLDAMAHTETKTELHVTANEGGQQRQILISGALNLHDDPSKIHKLLDLLELPKGTEVRVVTTASSVLVR